MVGEELLATGRVAAVNVAEDEPAKTVTLEGTVASEVLFEERETTAPPVGAAAGERRDAGRVWRHAGRAALPAGRTRAALHHGARHSPDRA